MNVYSKKWIDHFDHIAIVFTTCRKYGISLNLAKSIFGIKSSKLLGHIVYDSNISIDHNRVSAIQALSPPASKMGIQYLWER